LIALLVLALVIIGCVVVGKNPIGWAKARWYDLRDSTVVVDIERVVPVPPGSVAPEYGVAGLTDPRIAQSWATAWAANTAQPDRCGAGNGTGALRFVLPVPTRVRGIEIVPGVLDDDPGSARMFHAHRVDISWPGGGCVERELADKSGAQRFWFDTDHDVSRLTLRVATAYPPPANVQATELVAITEVRLLARPS
jgi:hypothetical protein